MGDNRAIQLTLPVPISGLNFEYPENLLDHRYTQDMMNAIIEDAVIKWRPGYTELAASYPNASSPILEGVEFGDSSGNLHVIFFDIAECTEFTSPSTWTDRSSTLDFTGTSANAIFAVTVGGLATENLYVTNGKDAMKVWTGTGNWSNLTTTGFTTLRGKCSAGFKGYYLIGDTTEDSNSYPYRVRWSKVGDPTVWNSTSSGFVNLIEDETNSKVMCMYPFSEVLIVYKFGSIYQLTYQGDPNYFVPRMRVADRGAISRKGVAPFGGAHLVVSEDNIHIFNGIGFIDPPPGNKIKRDFYGELNWEQREKIYTKAFPSRFEVWILYPSGDSTDNDKAYCWNYKDNTWTKHEFNDTIYSLMNFNQAFDTLQPMAGLSGNVMKFMNGTTDDGTDISTVGDGAYFRTKLHNYREFNSKSEMVENQNKTAEKVEWDITGSSPTAQFGYTNNLLATPTYESAKSLTTDGAGGRRKSDHRATGRYLTLKVNKQSGDTDFQIAQFTIYLDPRGSGR